MFLLKFYPDLCDPKQPNKEEIAACAYGIWMEEGFRDGRDIEH